ncbi:MAG: glycosyltransferase family 4 protein [Desulfobacterales bacterium]|nr:glycosyltransferase family 4 protein [Desulfobacterales bacterium]
MNSSMRVAVDCRRGLGSGVGRVTQSLAKAVVELSRSRPILPVLLMTPNAQSGFELLAEIHHINIPFHSQMDRLEYPQLLKQLNVDVFFAPQYYVTPYSPCVTVRHVHDLWPLLHPKWIPTPTEFGSRYGCACLEESLLFTTDYLRTPPKHFAENHYISSFVERNKENPIAMYYGVMFFLALELSSKIIVPSLHTLKEIRAVFPSALPRVSVIPNAVDPAFLLPEPQASLQMRNPDILHIANWEPRKNIECLLDAFARLRASGFSANLALIGNNGTSDYAKKIRRLIASHPYHESINVHGFISDDALSVFFRKALVFVSSSHYEGFCIPVQEAMASGVPVIASQKTALTEICGNAALFFDPSDPGMLADQLINVLTNAQLRQDLSVRGLANSRRFGIDTFTQSLMLLLHDMEEYQQ